VTSSPSLPSDAQLIEKLSQGDETAFEKLMMQYHSTLVRLANIYVNDQAVAEDVV
jgi:DNA-directed RNA polymerase specialized sigma24 family protein